MRYFVNTGSEQTLRFTASSPENTHHRDRNTDIRYCRPVKSGTSRPRPYPRGRRSSHIPRHIRNWRIRRKSK